MSWAAVIGSPIEHSLSPVLHRAAWDSLEIPQSWVYRRVEVTEDDLPSFMSGLDATCVGLSVTMPCKQAIIPLCDAVDPLAGAVGAVNTVINAGGLLTGFNTDVHGMVAAIRQARSHVGLPAPRSAVVLGARASASSALAALGTLGVTDIQVAARRFGGPGSVVMAATKLGLGIEHILWTRDDDVDAAICQADIVISTMPAGVTDDLASRIMSKGLVPQANATLLDIVYSPLDTPLVQAWRHSGGVIAHGLDMLLHQAALQVQLMTGREPDLSVMERALREALPSGAENSSARQQRAGL